MRKALMVLLAAAAGMLAQTTPDPAAYGPLPVASGQYRFNNAILPTVPYPVDIWGVAWWPENLPAGPYPLIVMLHGNHGICRLRDTMIDSATNIYPPMCPEDYDETPNHMGYDYLALRLASHGYIVVSINANSVNTRANGNPERGRLVMEHLRHWAAWNSAEGAMPFDRMFSGKVDLQRVGLMGHSRGGEGVRAAYEFNRREGAPFGVRALMEIGPVDFGATTPAKGATTGNAVYNADNVNFSVLLPGCDGDVLDNQGMWVYDRARVMREATFPSPKSQLYIAGANHNFYNSQWVPEDYGFRCIDFPIITDRAQQEAIGLAYVLGFFRTYIGGESFQYLFHGDRRPPENIQVPVAQSYTESPERILMVDDFSAKASPDTNSAGGSNAMNNIEIKSCSGASCNEPPPASWGHDSVVCAAKIAWPQRVDGGNSSLTLNLSGDGGPRDLSPYALLAFRAANQFDTRNPVLTTQDFSVRLLSGSAVSKTLAAADYKPILYPTGYYYRHSVLRTIRIPLADFSGVDLKRVTAVQFVFDKVPQGAIFLTDVHLSPQAQ